MRFSLKLSHKGLILVVIPLIFEISFILRMYVALREAEFLADRQFDAKQSVTAANDLIRLAYDAGTALFSFSVNRDPSFIERYRDAQAHISDQLDFLKTKTVNDSSLLECVLRMEHYVSQAQELLQQAKKAIEERGSSAALGTANMQAQLKPIINGLMTEVHQFTEQVNKKGYLNPDVTLRSRMQLREILVFGMLANILLAVALAIFFNKGTAERLKVLLQNTERLSKNLELNPPLKGADELAQLDHVFHDMADELEEAAQKERALTEFAADVIASLDAKGKFTKLNPACLKVWGYSPEELIGRDLVEMVAAKDKERANEIFQLVRSGQSKTALEVAFQAKNGSIVFHRFSLHWSEELQSFYCVFHDITEPKRIEQMKQQFVAMVSHDLRSPLMSIISVLAMLADGIWGPVTEQASRWIDQALKNSTRLISLINDLLEIENLE